MKASVIREMSLAEIRERIDTEKSAYQKLKMNHVVSSLENPVKLKYARKAIARLSTELTKREAGESTDATVKAPTKTKAAKAEETAPVEEVKSEETAEDVQSEEEVKETVEAEETDKQAQA